jgi:hypothetical protein
MERGVYLLNQPLLVHARRKIFEVDGALDRFSEAAHQFDVHVGFEQGGAYLLDHAIKSLE